MSKIVSGGDWCYVDELDGKAIKDGEVLDVTFPDGYQMRVKVTLQNSGITKEAYYVTDIHGAPARVRLLGFEATRVVF